MVKNKGMYFSYFSLNWGTFIDTCCIIILPSFESLGENYGPKVTAFVYCSRAHSFIQSFPWPCILSDRAGV